MARERFQQLPTFIALAGKSAKIVSFLKVIKLTKILLTASSLALSALLYGWAYGPLFAVGLLSMVFIHEMGHVIAMRQSGMKTAPPVFIPFLGAIIFAPPMNDRRTEAYVGYGGPFLGSLAALLCMAFWAITGSQLLLLTAFIGVYINLLNMIPISPLDGGRIGQIIGPRIVYVGMVILVGVTLFLGEPGLMLIWLLTLQEVRLNLWWQTIISGVLLTIMTAMFSFGIGTQPPFIDALDVFVGFLFFLLYCTTEIRAWHWIRLREERGLPPLPYWSSRPIRPYPPARTRYTWLAIYVASVAVLWTAMWYLIMQLPPPH